MKILLGDEIMVNPHDELMDNTFPKEFEIQLPTSIHSNLPNRADLTKATLNNLINLGILLRTEVDRYKALLDSYDNGMLFRTFLYSKEIKNSLCS